MANGLNLTAELVKSVTGESAPTADDVVEMAGDLLGLVALSQAIPVDFTGCTISILREPETNRLMAVIISPTDMHGDEPFARYAVEPNNVQTARPPRIVVPH